MVDRMLERIADYLDADIDSSVERAAAVIEPVLIGFLGTAVGGIVAAVLVPLYSAIGNIK